MPSISPPSTTPSQAAFLERFATQRLNELAWLWQTSVNQSGQDEAEYIARCKAQAKGAATVLNQVGGACNKLGDVDAKHQRVTAGLCEHVGLVSQH